MKPFLPLLLFLLAACTASPPSQQLTREAGNRYATLFSIAGDTLAVVNPWSTSQTLWRRNMPPKSKPRLLVATGMHCALIKELGAEDCIVAVLDSRYINVPSVQRAIRQGRIRDCGSSAAPDKEAIAAARPDLMLLSVYQGNTTGLAPAVVPCADYMEPTPLARAEWIRFYGRLVGRAHVADSIFRSVAQRYGMLSRRVARQVKRRPAVVTEKRTGSVWYIAGRQSCATQILRDAGASYLFDDVSSTGAVPYTPERAFARACRADVWLLRYNAPRPLTRADLASEWDAYRRMQAYQHRQVYACNLRYSTFYEDTAFHPDRALAEYVRLLHPELCPSYRNRYFMPVQ